MREYQYHMTEEIARWAFEVRCREAEDWYIAFTNPTAGPWKSVKALSLDGEEGEVYRFGSRETRPDIVLINDSLKIILIIEAKDSIAKLTAGDQAEKSAEVVSNMSKLFHGMTGEPCWGNRYRYRILTGLLWGAEQSIPAHVARHALRAYSSELRRLPSIDDTSVIGIETLRGNGGSLSCSLLYYLDGFDPDGLGPDYLDPDYFHPDKRSSGITEEQIKSIADSLHLKAVRC